jgi:hypothetical protein
MNNRSLVFFFLFSLYCLHLHAQEGWDGIITVGQVMKHTDRILADVTENSYGIQLNYARRFSGNKTWHHWQNFPEYGISFNAVNFGDHPIFGWTAGLYPFLGKQIKLSNRAAISLRMGMGIGFVSKKYDRQTNPTNNVISTHWNNMSGVAANFQFALSEHWQLNTGVYGIHLSNGGTILPNLGINYVAVQLGIRWQPNGSWFPQEALDMPMYYTPPKWGYNLAFGGAMRQAGNTVNGPLFMVYNFTGSGYGRLSNTSLLHLGLHIERNDLVKFFMEYTGFTDADGNALQYSHRMMIFPAYEVFFGNFSFTAEAGTYLQGLEFAPEILYFRLHCRYYFARIPALHMRTYAGIALKTHFATAEFFSIQFGTSFWNGR